MYAFSASGVLPSGRYQFQFQSDWAGRSCVSHLTPIYPHVPRMSAFRVTPDSGSRKVPGEAHVAAARAVTPMRRRQARQETFTEEQQLPSQLRSDMMAPRQVGFWSIIPYVAVAASVGFAGWLAVRRLRARQARLVEEFGQVMVYYASTPESMREIASEYKWKLGPGVLRGALYESYLNCLVSEKPVGPSAIKDAAIVKKLLRIGNGRATEIMNGLGEKLSKSSPSLLGKLLFLAERMLPFDQLPSLKLVPLFPYGAGTVVELQRNMMERCYREIVERELEESEVGELPMESARILRLDNSHAKSIFDGVVVARTKAKEAEAAAIAAAEVEDGPVPHNPELDSPARSGEPAKVAVHAYQCSQCGYTMFPAAGREFKFYGADFVCPTCGAPKDKFVDLNSSE